MRVRTKNGAHGMDSFCDGVPPMAGDWIRMRVWLARDPRVVAMADELATQPEFMEWLTEPFRRTCEQSAHEYVTRDVTVALCVTSLLTTWGMAREQGERDGDDLVVRFLDAKAVSQIAGVPGFGKAMVAVGWLTEEEGRTARFPKFFGDKASPHERHGDNAAERQRRYREKKRNERNATRNGDGDVTRDVTRYARGEESREESKEEHTHAALPRFVPPTVEEVADYCREKRISVDAERFVHFYESKGWMIGKNKMQKWKSAVHNFKNDMSRHRQQQQPPLAGLMAHAAKGA